MLFEAFAPADDARIAVVVALEAGRSGAHDAAPIARKILDAWLPGDQDRQAARDNAAAMSAATVEAARADARRRSSPRFVTASSRACASRARTCRCLCGLLALMAVGLVTLYSASDLDRGMVDRAGAALRARPVPDAADRARAAAGAAQLDAVAVHRQRCCCSSRSRCSAKAAARIAGSISASCASSRRNC